MKTVHATQAEILRADAASALAALRPGLEARGGRPSVDAGGVSFAFEGGLCRLRAGAGRLALHVEAAGLSDLLHLRALLAAQLTGCAGEAVLRWTGAGSDLVLPPNLRLVRVDAVEAVTPHVRRITLSGSDMERFASDEQIHVGLLLPAEGVEPAWPLLEEGGQVRWPAGPGSPALRRYTIRRHDMAAQTVEVDVVVHDEGGPGSAFALRARGGEVIGMVGPGGGGMPPAADWYLLLGDDTALPAIARMLLTLPAEAQGLALIEVAGPADEQRLVNCTGIEIRWLHRASAAPAAAGPLVEAARRVEFPAGDAVLFVWAACEFDAYKAIRGHLRRDRGLTKAQHLAVPYWRRGSDEDPRVASEEE